jgi:hypothetical protein
MAIKMVDIPQPVAREKTKQPEKAKKPAFDRVAYQREYMRKRRAKKKQKGGAIP